MIRVAEQVTTKNEQGEQIQTTATKSANVYNGSGQRAKKANGNQITYFIFDQLGSLIEEAGNSIADYVFLNGSPFVKLEGATVYYIHTDHLSTPQKMVDASKQIVWEINSMPFGETYSITGTAINNIRFPGQYYDDASGTSYNYFRNYDGVFGRYIESDPIGLQGGITLYNYVEQNPIRFTDREGLHGPLWNQSGTDCMPIYNDDLKNSEKISKKLKVDLKTELPPCDCTKIGNNAFIESIDGHHTKLNGCTVSGDNFSGEVVTIVRYKFATIRKYQMTCSLISSNCKNKTCGWKKVNTSLPRYQLEEIITDKQYWGNSGL